MTPDRAPDRPAAFTDPALLAGTAAVFRRALTRRQARLAAEADEAPARREAS